MRLVFAGTPAFAVPALEALSAAGHEIVAVVTQPDKPQGRKGIITPPPVKVAAQNHGIPVFQPEKIGKEEGYLRSLQAECMVTCAFGQILPRNILQVFPKGVWNIHASLLPAYRGASPIQWCVVNGEKETGITIMRTEEGLDTGGILLVKRTKITKEETAGELAERLSLLGAEAVVEAMDYIAEDEPQLLMQDEARATTVKKIVKEQAKIDWEKDAETVCNLVRGMNPAPIAYALLSGQAVNIFRARPVEYEGAEALGEVLARKKLTVKCARGAVEIAELQFAGGKRMSGADALNGRKIERGQILQ